MCLPMFQVHTNSSPFYVSSLVTSFPSLQTRRAVRSSSQGAVHKERHAIFGQFLPPSSPRHTSSHIPGPPESTSHISDPRFLEGLVQKNGQKPLVQILSQLFAGVFVRGSFVWKVLFGVVFVRSRSVRIHLLHQKVKHHFKFHVSYI